MNSHVHDNAAVAFLSLGRAYNMAMARLAQALLSGDQTPPVTGGAGVHIIEAEVEMLRSMLENYVRGLKGSKAPPGTPLAYAWNIISLPAPPEGVWTVRLSCSIEIKRPPGGVS